MTATINSAAQTTTVTIDGTLVSVQRRSSSDGNDCNYTGALAADGVTVSGVYFCTITGGPWYWRATIN